MRRRRRFNERLRSIDDVERHIKKNISRDYEDVAEEIIDVAGIEAVVEGYIADNPEVIDVLYYEDAFKICKEHSSVITAWQEVHGNGMPRRIGTFGDIAMALAANLYYVVTNEIYSILEDLDRDELESLI